MSVIGKTILEYKGYFGSVEIDVDSNTLSGTVQGLNDVVHYEAKNPRGLEKAFRGSVDDYLAFCDERGGAPERPYSGKFNARVGADIHRKAASLAAAEGVSMNEILVRALTREIDERQAGRAVPRRA